MQAPWQKEDTELPMQQMPVCFIPTITPASSSFTGILTLEFPRHRAPGNICGNSSPSEGVRTSSGKKKLLLFIENRTYLADTEKSIGQSGFKYVGYFLGKRDGKAAETIYRCMYDEPGILERR